MMVVAELEAHLDSTSCTTRPVALRSETSKVVTHTHKNGALIFALRLFCVWTMTSGRRRRL